MVDTHDGGVMDVALVVDSAIVVVVVVVLNDSDTSIDCVTRSTRLHKSSQDSNTHLRMIGISFNCLACEHNDDKLANPTMDAIATGPLGVMLCDCCCSVATSTAAMRDCTKLR